MTRLPVNSAVEGVADTVLLQELIARLEFVGAGGLAVPNPTMDLALGNIQCIHAELRRRGLSPNEQLLRLGERKQWRVQSFFEDCLVYPTRLPYVRELDGIRLCFRCWICRNAEFPPIPPAIEFPPQQRAYHYCDRCLAHLMTALHEGKPLKNFLIFRTFSAEARCVHADSDTVLACELSSDNIIGFCEECIREELRRRETS